MALYLQLALGLGWGTSKTSLVETTVDVTVEWIGWILAASFGLSLGLISTYRQILTDELENSLYDWADDGEFAEYRLVLWFPLFLSIFGGGVLLILAFLKGLGSELSYILSVVLLLVALWSLTSLWEAVRQTWKAGDTSARMSLALRRFQGE